MNMELKKLFYTRIALTSAVITPIATFLHELVHITFMELGGIDAHLLRFSMASPVNYNYDFSGLAEAIIFYESSDYTVFLAAIAAPIFTLLIAYLSLLLFKRTSRPVYYIMAVSPLFMRMAGISEKLPAYLKGTVTGSDEAIAAYFFGVPLTTFYWPSLILGYLCLILSTLLVKKNIRVGYLLSTVIGSLFGFALIELSLNFFLQ